MCLLIFISILPAVQGLEELTRRSSYVQNIDYARSLLTKLEQDALAVKIHSRRQELQADLNQKRDVLEQVTERFQELDDVGEDSDEDSSEGEDLLGDIIDTPSESVESGEAADRQRGDDGDSGLQDEEEEEVDESTVLPEPRISHHHLPPTESATTSQTAPTTTAPAPAPQPTTAGTSTSQTLRPRTGASQPAAPDKAGTTALRTELFGTRTDTASPSTTTATATATAEAIMDHHRAEQDKLTASMVAMARALKESSHRFASSLQEDHEVLSAATSNLERNERGLGAVAGRMGLLRRATEGKGWWGRVLLYLWIAGLAVFAVLLVFVFPKLRF